jgi:hypothetical protein
MDFVPQHSLRTLLVKPHNEKKRPCKGRFEPHGPKKLFWSTGASTSVCCALLAFLATFVVVMFLFARFGLSGICSCGSSCRWVLRGLSK